MLRAIDSQTNFVLVNTGRPVAHVIEHFQTHHITLPQPFPGFAKHVRVSLGTPEDMRTFWRIWDRMPGGGHTMSTTREDLSSADFPLPGPRTR